MRFTPIPLLVHWRLIRGAVVESHDGMAADDWVVD
jgi:hypothetical protein